jgi:histidinol phosphatase-like PHP family hydrolase
MKKKLYLGLLLTLVSGTIVAQVVRKDIKVPDILDYKTLKCDFHIHTVFSDGQVWPTTRVDEAWIQGLDAIAITDHIEYQPHKEYIPVRHNAAYEIARPQGERQDLIVIHGSEITRRMPPGHLNAIFLNDANSIETSLIHHKHTHSTPSNYMDSIDHVLKDYMNALRAANEQDAFIFWNHPGWVSQAPEGIRFYEVHKDLIERGWLKGIEVANSSEWYPEAFQWCIKYDLAMLSNSDVHPTEAIYESSDRIEHRPITLVFAEDRSAESIKEALEAARTVVWFNDLVIGRKEYIEPLFYNSIEISDAFFTDNRARTYHNLKNQSDFKLQLVDIDTGERITLPPQSTSIVLFDGVSNARHMEVENFIIGVEKHLEVILQLN